RGGPAPQRLPAWLVANVAVHPACRRRGIARHLVQAAICHVHERGGGLVVLDVRRENQPAYALYQSLSFTLREETTERRWLPGLAWPARPSPGEAGRFRALLPSEWPRAHALMVDAVGPLAAEAAPISEIDLRAFGLLGPLLRLGDWLSGRQVQRL